MCFGSFFRTLAVNSVSDLGGGGPGGGFYNIFWWYKPGRDGHPTPLALLNLGKYLNFRRGSLALGLQLNLVYTEQMYRQKKKKKSTQQPSHRCVRDHSTFSVQSFWINRRVIRVFTGFWMWNLSFTLIVTCGILTFCTAGPHTEKCHQSRRTVAWYWWSLSVFPYLTHTHTKRQRYVVLRLAINELDGSAKGQSFFRWKETPDEQTTRTLFIEMEWYTLTAASPLSPPQSPGEFIVLAVQINVWKSRKHDREHCHFVSGSLCLWRHEQGRHVWLKWL